MTETVLCDEVARTRLADLEKRFDQHQEAEAEALREIREELKAIRDDLARRLPIWVTFVLSLCAGTIGSLVTALVRK